MEDNLVNLAPLEKSVAIRLCTQFMVSDIRDTSIPRPLRFHRHRDDPISSSWQL